MSKVNSERTIITTLPEDLQKRLLDAINTESTKTLNTQVAKITDK
jgi:hypothetical protein